MVVDTLVDARTLHEIYLPAFETCRAAGTTLDGDVRLQPP